MTDRTFDRNAAIRDASQRVMAKLLADEPHNAAAIGRQVAAPAHALQCSGIDVSNQQNDPREDDPAAVSRLVLDAIDAGAAEFGL